MGYQEDVQVALKATVHAPRDDVMRACRRAADFLGAHAVVTSAGPKVKVVIKPGITPRLSYASPTVGITVSPQNGDVVQVEARIEQYKTLQHKMLVLIPYGPKRLVGKVPYLNLLTSLENELKAVDRNSAVRRVGAFG